MKKTDLIRVLESIKNIFDNDSKVQTYVDYLIKKFEETENADFSTAQYEEGVGGSYPLPTDILTENQYALFSDGACRGNPGPGAWGVLCQNCNGDILFESSGVDLLTTNNKMELQAALEAIKILENFLGQHFESVNLKKLEVFVYSDSKYLVDGMQKWIFSWKKRDWKKADNKAPENLEIWQALDQVVQKFSLIKFIWIKGHNNHPQNERCDELCNRALNEAGF